MTENKNQNNNKEPIRQDFVGGEPVSSGDNQDSPGQPPQPPAPQQPPERNVPPAPPQPPANPSSVGQQAEKDSAPTPPIGQSSASGFPPKPPTLGESDSVQPSTKGLDTPPALGENKPSTPPQTPPSEQSSQQPPKPSGVGDPLGNQEPAAGEDVFTPPQIESSLPESSDSAGGSKKSGLKLFVILLSLAVLIIGAAAVYFLILADTDEVVVPDLPPANGEELIVSASLSANNVKITEGESVVLVWSSDHAVACEGFGFDTGGETSGEVEIFPEETVTYSITCEDDEGNTDSQEALITVEEAVVVEPPRDYVSYFGSTDGTREAELQVLDISNIHEEFEVPLSPEFFEGEELPVESYLVDFGLVHENRLLELGDIAGVLMPGVLPENIVNEVFEPDVSLFAYYEGGEIWPGIVAVLNEETLMSDDVDGIYEFIGSAIEGNTSSLSTMFYEEEGNSSEWRDGSASGITTRFNVFSESPAALNYGWANDSTLLITTSYQAFLSALGGI